jgi:putative flippase GtrA
MKKKLLKLYKEHREIANYLIVGGLTTLVSLVVKYALLFTILDAKNAVQLQVAVIISWIISVAFAYWANRKFVFESKSKQILKEIGLFVASRISTLLLDMLIMWFFVTFLKLDSDVWVIVWTIVSQVLVIILNYILSKFFVFKKK